MIAEPRPGTPQHAAVVGMGWGDEGKGKVVDLLSGVFDVVVRYNGGANAGHTVWIKDESFALHLVPVGILRPGVTSVIGPGVVLDPDALLTEIDMLVERGVEVGENLRISDRAHVVMPYHKFEDQASEGAADTDGKIGTTARGIGPCYADKMRRSSAIRAVDLLDLPRHRERIERIIAMKSAMLNAGYDLDVDLDPGKIFDALQRAANRLRPHICDTTQVLAQAAADGRRLLFEGANGMLLDVDHGTYPFVTSSSTGPGGVATGAGVPPLWVNRVVGVTKAYATRVGEGPFVSELDDATGQTIRERGKEYGTTTGRPRRCGWYDAVLARYSAHLGGVTDLAIMHLDTLCGFEKVGVCTGYRLDGKTLSYPPSDAERLRRAEPVLEFLDGWSEAARMATRLDGLPETARRYLARIESLVGVRVSIVGVGPEREKTLIHEDLVRCMNLQVQNSV